MPKSDEEPPLSLAIYPVFEKKVPRFNGWGNVSGKHLAHAQPKLDKIAKKLRVAPLEKFGSVNPEELADFLESIGHSRAIAEGVRERWFDPSKGLKTVQSLLAALEKNSKSLGSSEHFTREGVTRDLKAMERVLLAAAKHKIRFHLAMDG